MPAAPGPLLLRRPAGQTPAWMTEVDAAQARLNTLARFEREASAVTDAWSAGDPEPAARLSVELCAALADAADYTPGMLDLFARAASSFARFAPAHTFSAGWTRPPVPISGERLTLAYELYSRVGETLSLLSDNDDFGYAHWCLDGSRDGMRELGRALAQVAVAPALGRLDDAAWEARRRGGLLGSFDVHVQAKNGNQHLLGADRTRTLCGRALAAGWKIADHCAGFMIDCRTCERRRADGTAPARASDERPWHSFSLTGYCESFAGSLMQELPYTPALTWAELQARVAGAACKAVAARLASSADPGTARAWTGGRASGALTAQQLTGALAAALAGPGEPGDVFCAALKLAG